MKTYSVKNKDIVHAWHLIDLKNQVLGRIATQIALLLQGKNKPYFTPNLDCGDNVVAINADKIKVTGRKAANKVYHRHSNYPGGFKTIKFSDQLTKDSRKIIYHAVKNMLPKNKLQDMRLRRLKVFQSDKHQYQDKFTQKS